MKLDLETAKKIADSAKRKALENGWPVVISIVDEGGHLVLLERMDGAQYGSIEVSMGKAKTAIAFRRSTKEWEKRLADGRIGYLSLPGVVPVEGGLPIEIEGKFVGAIGVSGVTSIQDGEIAAEGREALS